MINGKIFLDITAPINASDIFFEVVCKEKIKFRRFHWAGSKNYRHKVYFEEEKAHEYFHYANSVYQVPN